MNYVLTMLLASAVFSAALTSMRWAAAVVVLALSLTPYYLAVPLGNTLIPTRIIVLLICAVFCVAWVQHNHAAKTLFFARVRIAQPVLWLSLAFVVFSAMISIYLGNTRNWSLMSLGFDFIYSIGMLLMVFALLRDSRAEHGLFVAMTAALFICETLAMLEYQLQDVLLRGLIDESSIIGLEFFTDRAREGQYRVRALFDNHLMLAEFVTISWPFAWVVYCKSKNGAQKLLALVSLLFTPVVLFLAGARSGWLVFVAGISLLVFMKIRSKSGKYFRWFSNVIVSAIVVYLAYMIMDIFSAPEQLIDTEDSSGASTIERIGQFAQSYQLFMDSPWIGYGKGLDLEGANFLKYIDSYLLVSLLEGGLIGLVIFMSIWLLVFKHAGILIRYSQQVKHDHHVALALMVSVFSLLFFQLFISVPWNNIYLFFVEGLIVARLCNLPSMTPCVIKANK